MWISVSFAFKHPRVVLSLSPLLDWNLKQALTMSHARLNAKTTLTVFLHTN